MFILLFPAKISPRNTPKAAGPTSAGTTSICTTTVHVPWHEPDESTTRQAHEPDGSEQSTTQPCQPYESKFFYEQPNWQPIPE